MSPNMSGVPDVTQNAILKERAPLFGDPFVVRHGCHKAEVSYFYLAVVGKEYV